jgi:chromosome segregation ATPase
MPVKNYEPFDSKGQIIMPTDEQLAQMDDATRERVQHVLTAHAALAESEKHAADHQARIEDLTKQIAAAENTLKDLAPPITFQNLWNDMKASS